jgi:Ca-activated chloride channel family protein
MIYLDFPFEYQLALAAFVLLTIFIMIKAWRKRFEIATFAFPAKRLKGVKNGWRAKIVHLPFMLRCLALLAFLIALARPQLPQEESASVEGIDIVVAFDLSGSMATVDISDEALIKLQNRGKEPPDRFEIATKVVREFIESRKYDRVSLVVFGKESFLQFPLTLDYGVMLKILDEMKLGDIDGNGTAIGNALAMSLSRLKESEAKTKLIILMTDGEDNGSKIAPMEVAKEAAKQGVPVFTILVGSNDQSRQPTGMVDAFSGAKIYQKVDTPVNSDLLEKIAKETKSKFYRASDQEQLSKDFQDILDSFEKSRLVDYAVAQRTELFPALIGFGLFCLMLELMLSQLLIRRFP